jgi:hypothetical protein
MVSAVDGNDVYYKNILITSFGTLSEDMQKNVALKNTESENWRSELQKVNNDSEKDLNKYYYPNGPVLGLGIDIYGTLIVQIYKDWDVNQSTIKDIYQVIEKNGEKHGIKNIPCKFLSMGILIIESRSDKIRPVLGGLKLTSTGGWVTTGFRARNNAGNLGIVTAGHFGSIGSAVYQPDSSVSGSSVGTISSLGTTNSDSAFIPYSNTVGTFYINDNAAQGYSSYSSIPAVDRTVWKSGAATDLTSGTMAFTSQAWNPYLNKYLPNQGYASYSSAPGDSGAPVFTWDYFDPVLVGIHVGSVDPGFGVFSSISGTSSDLGVTPAL